MSNTKFNVKTLIHMLVNKFIVLPSDKQDQEFEEISILFGDDTIPFSEEKPNETEDDFKKRYFSELLLELEPDSLNLYRISFFESHGFPTDVDRLIQRLKLQPVGKQEEEIRKLSGLTGGESVPKLPKEREDKYRIRSFFELLLKLNVDSMENYKRTFYDTYEKMILIPEQNKILRQTMQLKLDEKAPAGFNSVIMLRLKRSDRSFVSDRVF